MDWQAIVAALKTALQGQLAGGVIALSIVGGAFAFFRSVPQRLWRAVRRQIVVTVDVPGSDPLFGWMAVWLDRHPYSKRSRLLTASVNASHSGGPTIAPAGKADEADGPQVLFTPAPGRHLLWFRRRPILLSRERKEISGRDGYSGGYQETLVLQMFGRNADAARSLLEDARRLAHDGVRRIGVYAVRWGEWSRMTEVQPRPLASVILPAGVMERLIADAKDFLAARDWYTERGIPWRRGYLLDGPPGTGKSSAIAALAGHLKLDLYVCTVGGVGMNDERLSSLLLSVPERSAVLLEDVDGIVRGREMQTEGGVTFAGLLNALDGVASRPGVVTFLTTNHPDALDPALIRKGRVDYRLTLGPATEEQVARMFRHFYGDAATETQALAFAGAMAGCVMADVQGVLLEHKHDPAGAVRAVSPARRNGHARALVAG